MSATAQESTFAPARDFVLPFDIAKAGVRGRFVRLDTASARALEAHKLPAPLYVAGEKQPRWRAAGLMLQMTPEASKAPGRNEDDWNRLSLLTKTVEDLELVDTDLAPETVLWRLFHEDEVRVQPAEPLPFRCDCDAARITSVLKSYALQEREGLADPDGIIRARCEFCGTTHEIAPETLT